MFHNIWRLSIIRVGFIEMLFHLQILTCYGISERGRIIAQCTEENNISRRFVMNLNVFVVFFYKPSNQEQMLSVTVNST